MYNDPNGFSGMMGGGAPQMGGYGAGGPSHYGNDTIGGAMMGGMGGPPPHMMGGGGGGYRGRGGRGRGMGRGMGMGGMDPYGGGGGYGAGGGYGGLLGNAPQQMMGGGGYGGHHNPHDPTDVRNRCNFFHKMGACRHGDNCTKFHNRPANGQTVMFPKMFANPLAMEYLTDREWGFEFDKKYLKKHFHNFYKGIWRTFMKFGRIAELRVVSNLCEHLVGNVYVKFVDPATALFVCEHLRHRKYQEILLLPEMCPITDFSEACCKEDRDSAGCERKLQCNFLHLMKVSREVMEKLVKEQDEHWEAQDKIDKEKREKEEKERERAERKAKEREEKEREREKDRNKGSSSSHREGGGDRDKDRSDRRDKSSRDKRDKRDDRDRDRDRKDKVSSSDRDRKDSRSDRRDRRDVSRDRRDRSKDRRRDSSRDRRRDRRDVSRDRRDRSKDRSDRRDRDRDRDRDDSRDRHRRSKRDRSPAGGASASDDRLCMVCGKKGHISKECPLKL